jgi:hypothetical protein
MTTVPAISFAAFRQPGLDGRSGKAATASMSASQATPCDRATFAIPFRAFPSAGFRRPQRQSRYGLHVGIASDAFMIARLLPQT